MGQTVTIDSAKERNANHRASYLLIPSMLSQARRRTAHMQVGYGVRSTQRMRLFLEKTKPLDSE